MDVRKLFSNSKILVWYRVVYGREENKSLVSSFSWSSGSPVRTLTEIGRQSIMLLTSERKISSIPGAEIPSVEEHFSG